MNITTKAIYIYLLANDFKSIGGITDRIDRVYGSINYPYYLIHYLVSQQTAKTIIRYKRA